MKGDKSIRPTASLRHTQGTTGFAISVQCRLPAGLDVQVPLDSNVTRKGLPGGYDAGFLSHAEFFHLDVIDLAISDQGPQGLHLLEPPVPLDSLAAVPGEEVFHIAYGMVVQQRGLEEDTFNRTYS